MLARLAHGFPDHTDALPPEMVVESIYTRCLFIYAGRGMT